MVTYEDLIRKLYAGCGLEGDMRELALLLRQLSKEYFAEDATDDDAKAQISKICKVVVAQMASCGKQYSIDQCEKEMFSALQSSPPDSVFIELRRNMQKKRNTNMPSGTPIL